MPTEHFEFDVDGNTQALGQLADRIDDLTYTLQKLSKQESAISREGEKAEQQLSKLGKMSSLNWRQAVRDVDHLGDSLRMVTGSVKGVFDTADALADLGKAQVRATESLRAITGTGYDAYMDAISRATLGTVNNTEAAQLAFKELRLGMVSSAAEAEQFTHTMAIIAASNPDLGGTAEAVNQIALTIANMSYMRLDQLGISAAAVRKRVAELKDEIQGISDEEAFKTAVMEELEQQAAQLGDTLLEVDGATQRLSAQFDNLKADIGLKVAAGFEGAAVAIESAGAALDYFNTHADEGSTENFMQFANAVGLGLGMEPETYDAAPSGAGGRGFGGGGETLPPPPDFTQLLTSYTNLAAAELVNVRAAIAAEAAARKAFYEDTARQMEAYYAIPDNQVPFIETSMDLDAFYARQLDDGQDYYNSLILGFQKSGELAQAAQEAAEEHARLQDMVSDSLYQRGLRGDLMPDLDALDINSAAELADLLGHLDEQARSAGGGITVLELVEGQLADRTRSVTDTLSGAASAMRQMETAAGSASEQFDSLEEKFGLSPDAFNVDIAGEVQSALGAAGVSADIAADAMFLYEHATGIANAQSAVFSGQMDTLAVALAAGTLTVEEYVASIQALETLDMTNLNALMTNLLSQGDTTGYQALIDKMSSMSPEQLTQLAGAADKFKAFMTSSPDQKLASLLDLLRGSGGEGKEGEEGPTSPLTPLLNDMDTATKQLVDADTGLLSAVTTFNTAATEQFASFGGTAVDEVGRVQDALNNLKGMAFTLSFSATGGGGGSSSAGGTGSSLPTAMAKGGRVLKGVEYIGGEEGFEFFIPDTNGEIIPHDESVQLLKAFQKYQSMMVPQMANASFAMPEWGAGGGGGGSNYHFNGPMNFWGVQDARQLLKTVEDEMRRQNKPVGRVGR